MSLAGAPARVVCVGGATVDRTYRLAAALDLETSNPASARIGHGGVARNVAENLAGLGVQVDLVSRVGDDAAGLALVAALAAAGIGRSGVSVAPGEATADYVAVLTPGGDLALGLSAMAVLDGLTPRILAAQDALIAAADWVFADCNLPAASLLALARRAAPRARYRLAVDAVSVAKSARLPDRLDGIDLLFLNRDEGMAAAKRRGMASGAPADVAAALVGAGAALVVVTLGVEGALVASAAGVVPVPALPTRIVDVTGAGDALVAATIHAMTRGADPVEAVRLGCLAASRTVARSGAVAAGPEPRAAPA